MSTTIFASEGFPSCAVYMWGGVQDGASPGRTRGESGRRRAAGKHEGRATLAGPSSHKTQHRIRARMPATSHIIRHQLPAQALIHVSIPT